MVPHWPAVPAVPAVGVTDPGPCGCSPARGEPCGPSPLETAPRPGRSGSSGSRRDGPCEPHGTTRPPGAGRGGGGSGLRRGARSPLTAPRAPSPAPSAPNGNGAPGTGRACACHGPGRVAGEEGPDPGRCAWPGSGRAEPGRASRTALGATRPRAGRAHARRGPVKVSAGRRGRAGGSALTPPAPRPAPPADRAGAAPGLRRRRRARSGTGNRDRDVLGPGGSAALRPFVLPSGHALGCAFQGFLIFSLSCRAAPISIDSH